jgi:hypothetical protein
MLGAHCIHTQIFRLSFTILTITYVLATAVCPANPTELTPVNARGALVVNAEAVAKRERTDTANFMISI